MIVKISLFASIILFGYNLSLAFNRYASICRKALLYREVLLENSETVSHLRRTNLALSSFASIIYLALLYLSNLSFWFLAIVVLKIALSILFSDTFQRCIVLSKDIPQRLYWNMKFDSIVNSLGTLLIMLVLVY